MTETTKVFRVHIKASPERVWAAIVEPGWTAKYGYQCQIDYGLKPGGVYAVFPSPEMKDYGAPDVILDGEVLESDPPRKLVHTWRVLWDEEAKAEGFSTVTYDLAESRDGITILTLTHVLENSPRSGGLASGDIPPFGGGWPEILSDLKSLLETGSSMHG